MTPLAPIYEILAKELVYGFNQPQFQQQVVAGLTQLGYQIDRTFVDPNTGFQAFGLRSLVPGRSPVLVLRGGDEQLDDRAFADTNSVGFNQFTANKQAIGDWISAVTQATDFKPDVVGHSLGGALAQLTASEFATQVGNVVTFNSPGVNQTVADQFQTRGGTAAQVTHYIVSGDFVSLAGQTFLPGTAILQSYSDQVTIENQTYEVIDPVFTLDKHREKALKLLASPPLGSPPPGYSETTIPIGTLANSQFNFQQDPDFAQFAAAYRPLRPQIANALNSRATTEILRTSPNFSFFSVVFEARTILSIDQPNLLVGNAQNNFANGGKGNDRILGQAGNDRLRGGASDDRILGGIGQDTLLGDAGNDTLIGGRQSDLLLGGGGSDTLTGVNPTDRRAGRREVDILTGNGGSDLFILGNRSQAFYNTPGGSMQQEDYAQITDFQRGDRIQLYGSAADYVLRSTTRGMPFVGTGIFLQTANGEELIGVIAKTAGLSLTSQSFQYV